MFVKLSEEAYYYTSVFNFKLKKKKTVKSFSFKNWLVEQLWSVHTVETRLSCSEKSDETLLYKLLCKIVSGMSSFFPNFVVIVV